MCSFDLQQMDTVFHEAVMRKLCSPVDCESLGKKKPPLRVEHRPFLRLCQVSQGCRIGLYMKNDCLPEHLRHFVLPRGTEAPLFWLSVVCL